MKKKLFKRLSLILLLFAGGAMFSQSTVLTGVVTDKTGPVPGANVLIKGASSGTVTDFDGNFEISVDYGDVLVFSYLGLKTKEIEFTGQESLDVFLEDDEALLEEVVVLGYGKSVRKEDLTGAVSSVGIEDIEKAPLVDVSQALQGRASGVQITQNSGAPGAGLKIRVRGSNSITGNNSPLVVVDGLVDVDINSVNPADIQSISILKDASSAAIYGNRAANGVIIIKTKQGIKGAEPVIEFGSYFGFSDPSNTIDLLGAAEFIDFANAKNIGASGNPIPVFDTQDKINQFVANAVDYQEAVYRTAVVQNYQLSYRGGGENVNYFVSGNYLDQEGLAINTNFKRYSLRSNINTDLTDKLSVNASINLIRREGFNNDPGFGADLALGAVGFDPTTPIFDSNGNYNRRTLVVGGIQESVLTNPVFLANENERVGTTNRVQTNVQINYNLLPNLDLNLSAGIDYANITNGFFIPPNDDVADIVAGQNTLNSNNTQYAVRLTYDNTFNEIHSLNATAIYEERDNNAKGFNADGRDFFTPSTGFNNLGIANIRNIGSFFSERKLRSLIGRATYNYDSRYLLTASARYDESSVFIKDQGAVFPSFALAWNINNEDFFNSEEISTLRLRAGWGETGNELIETTDALNLLRNNPWIPNGGGAGSTAILPGTRLANPDLTWETTTQTNIGLDFGILNNRFNFVFEYYVKNTEDLLLVRNLPRFTGRVDQVVNAGEVQNKGIDLTLSGTVIQNDNFTWDVSANLTSNKNEVIGLIGDETEIFPSLEVGGSIVAPSIVRIGEPIGSFYGFTYEGVNPENGNAIYSDEQDIIGDPNPDFIYGINNDFAYKNFDLNIFIQGVQGNDVFNRARSLIIGRDGRIPFGTSVELRNTWTPSNTSAPLPSINATNTELQSSEFIEDGSFLRLKNISLGYRMRDVSALNAMGVESLRLYISGQNLITITDYSGLDPEVNNGGENDRLAGIDIGALPTPKTITIGLDVKF